MSVHVMVLVTVHPPPVGSHGRTLPPAGGLPKESPLQLMKPPDLRTSSRKIQGTEQQVEWCYEGELFIRTWI